MNLLIHELYVSKVLFFIGALLQYQKILSCCHYLMKNPCFFCFYFLIINLKWIDCFLMNYFIYSSFIILNFCYVTDLMNQSFIPICLWIYDYFLLSFILMYSTFNFLDLNFLINYYVYIL